MKNKILLFLKGMAMGAADVVPGVSGGTIAFITGIYGKLLDSIHCIDLQAVRLLFSGKLREFWDYINGTFLLILFAGIGVSILSLSKLIVYLLDTYPEMVWSFFFGLILASAVVVFPQVRKYSVPVYISAGIGVMIAYIITEISQTQTPTDLWFLFLSGALAVCAMILPGISGSFILLLLGKYKYIMHALDERDFLVLGTVAAGAVVGLLTFSRLLRYLLRNFHDVFIAILTGFMIGSLNKVWPWKVTLETYVDRHGEVKPLNTENVSPFDYPGESFLIPALILAVAGFLLVYLLEKYTRGTPDGE